MSAPIWAALAVYYVGLAAPLPLFEVWRAEIIPQSAAIIRLSQLFGLLGFLALSLFTMSLRIRFDPIPALAWTGFVSWCFLSTIWSHDPLNTAFYSCLLALLLLASLSFWSKPPKAVSMAALLGSLAILAALAYAATVLEIRERTLGFVQPNLIASFGFAALVLAYLARGRPKYFILPIALVIVIFAQSRGTFVALALFLTIYHLVLPFVSRKSLVEWLIMLTIVAGILTISLEPLTEWGTRWVTERLGVTDPSRGTDSGFTGRADIWKLALEAARDRELAGFGFRTRGLEYSGPTLNAHSGILNALLDVGIIGVALFALTYLLSMLALLSRWARSRKDADRVAVAFIVAFMPLLVIEPNYLNFAHPASFLMILFLAAALKAPDGAPSDKRPLQHSVPSQGLQ